MSILVRRCLGRSRLVEELVENWQIEHKQAMFAGDMEELVVEFIALGELIQHGWESMIDRLFDEKIDNIDAAGDMMRAAISRTLKVSTKLEEFVGLAEQMQNPIDKAHSFRSVVRNLQHIDAEVKKRWPTVNARMLNDSLAAYERGEFRTTEDLLGDTQDCGSKAY
jgi:hypothetical protein